MHQCTSPGPQYNKPGPQCKRPWPLIQKPKASMQEPRPSIQEPRASIQTPRASIQKPRLSGVFHPWAIEENFLFGALDAICFANGIQCPKSFPFDFDLSWDEMMWLMMNERREWDDLGSQGGPRKSPRGQEKNTSKTMRPSILSFSSKCWGAFCPL